MSTDAQIAYEKRPREAARTQELVEGNLGTCFIFEGLARTQLKSGDRGAAERSFGRARTCHEAAQHFLGRAENEQHRHAFQPKLDSLEEKLEELKGQLQP